MLLFDQWKSFRRLVSGLTVATGLQSKYSKEQSPMSDISTFRHMKIRMKSQRMETALGYPALDGAEIQQLVNEQVVKESEEMKQRLIENFKPSPDQSYLLLS